jgi:hypothetical protein
MTTKSNNFKDEYNDKGVLKNYVIIEVIEEKNNRIEKYKLRYICYNEKEANNNYDKLKKIISNKLLLLKDFNHIC